MSERRLRQRRQREEAILMATLRVCGQKGIQEATIDDIAAEVGLGKGTLYYYFPSKEAILARAIEASVEAHFEGMLEQGGTFHHPYDLAAALLSRCADNYRRQPALFKLIYLILAEPQRDRRAHLARFNRCHLRWLEQLEALAAPLLAPYGLDPGPFIHLVGTVAHGMTLMASSGRPLERLLTDSLHSLRQILKNIQEVCPCHAKS